MRLFISEHGHLLAIVFVTRDDPFYFGKQSSGWDFCDRRLFCSGLGVFYGGELRFIKIFEILSKLGIGIK